MAKELNLSYMITNFWEIFQYQFFIRGLEAGIIIGALAPLIGIFLVLRRYSLIADTLAHVSLAGVAVGLLLKVNPIITAILASLVSSLVIERLRNSQRVFGESALAIFLSGSLALAIILISFIKNVNIDLINYLFGSIVTVKQSDVYLIGFLGLIVLISVIVFYKELTLVTFDEESARVSGIPTKFINNLLIVLSSFTVALSIPIVGVLLTSALIVIPVVTALQFRKSFKQTIFIAEGISLFSVLCGIFSSFFLNISTGGTIVLITIIIFIFSLLFNKR